MYPPGPKYFAQRSLNGDQSALPPRPILPMILPKGPEDWVFKLILKIKLY